MCPHTTIYVSACFYICVRTLLRVLVNDRIRCIFGVDDRIRCICVLILLYVSSYFYCYTYVLITARCAQTSGVDDMM